MKPCDGKTMRNCEWHCGRGGHLAQGCTVKRAKPMVMIVDRDDETVRTLEGALASAGIDAVSMGTGADPIQFSREVQPNLVLLDADAM
jgi:ActR/RegA family two-component response regulator